MLLLELNLFFVGCVSFDADFLYVQIILSSVEVAQRPFSVKELFVVPILSLSG